MSAEPASALTAHITPNTPLSPAIRAWQFFLNDQGRSPHTVKAFSGDVLLLSSYLPPDRSVGSISTQDLNHFIQWLLTKRGVPCSPKSLARRITSLKAFFRWLHQGGVLPGVLRVLLGHGRGIRGLGLGDAAPHEGQAGNAHDRASGLGHGSSSGMRVSPRGLGHLPLGRMSVYARRSFQSVPPAGDFA